MKVFVLLTLAVVFLVLSVHARRSCLYNCFQKFKCGPYGGCRNHRDYTYCMNYCRGKTDSMEGEELSDYQTGVMFMDSLLNDLMGEEESFETESDMTHSQALSRISSAGIGIHSSGGCSNRNVRTCTSLDGVRDNTINMITTLKRASGCPITITGGTEVGHSPGAKSHSSGHKLDISLNSCISSYITKSFSNAGKRGDGATLYKSSAGNVYALEGNHWDILFP